MKQLRILYDHQVFVSQRYGGVSRIFYELVKHLVSNKELHLMLFQGYHINRFPMEELSSRLGFYQGKKLPSFPRANVFLKPLNHFYFQALAATKFRKNPPHIYHPTGFSSNVFHCKRCPVILTVFDLIPELFPGDFRDHHARLTVRKKCIQRADAIITISQHTKKDLLEYYNVPQERIFPIHLGAPEPLTVNEHILPQNGERWKEKPFILYVGTRKQQYKNFRNLLIAYTLSPQLSREFNLLCFGGPPFTREECKYMERLGCRDRVFHRVGDDPALAFFYRGAAAFVYPSLYEGFGLPPLEAMAYHCPVITSKVSAIPEVLEDAAAYFEPQEPHSINEALKSVLFDQSVSHQLVEKGKKQVKKYSWNQTAEDTSRLYRQIAR